ncbi:MAG: methionyl-tRNA formyltransferase [Deltaproteobacteria bacterium GWA2_45_12]|nr:MAG: methionyl-tRNA formyltransferase [Deltaproteobacteria bacterium GWA2_45_12]
MNPSILFFGTPEFGKIILEKIMGAGYPLVGVVTQPDRPSGRGQEMKTSACALFAKGKNLPLFQPETLKNKETLAVLKNLNPDFIVSAAYGLFLPHEILTMARIDILNVHPSLLPLYRGAAPIQRAILDGKKETGVTIMRTTAKMDSGPIFLQKKHPITPENTSATLHDKLASLGGELLVEVLEKIPQGLTAYPQDETQVSYAPMLKKEEGCIQWDNPAQKILNQIHAFHPWPSAYTFIDNKRLKIYDGSVLPEVPQHNPGTIYLISPKGLHVACRGTALCISEVHLEGKKRMPAFEFAKGSRLKEGMTFS